MKLQEVLDKTVQFFKSKGIDSARLDSEILISSALNLKRIDLYLKFDQPLKDDEIQKCREYVKRRASGEPVAYILGEKGFYKRVFKVNSHVLIPRPETEHIIEQAITWYNNSKKISENEITILDIGSGSGCIGLTLAAEFINAKVICIDNSELAIMVAKDNACELQLQDRIEFLNGDAIELFPSLLSNKFDIIVSNPPYIDNSDVNIEEMVKKYEPNSALFAPDNGLEFLKHWSTYYSRLLKPESIMLFEMGMTQGFEMKTHFEKINKFSKIEIIKDLSSKDRIIKGECCG